MNPIHAGIITTLASLSLVAGVAAEATQVGVERYYVAPDGSDANPGSLDQPFETLAHAQAAVRGDARLGKNPIMVKIREGTYYLAEPLVFTARDSGAAKAPVTWAAHAGETVVLSGGAKLTLEWTPYRDGIYQATTPEGMEFDQLFVNGERQHMARYPDFDPKIHPYHGYAADAFSPERAAGWANPVGGFIHAMHKHHWGGYHYRITGKEPDSTVNYEGGWQNNRQMGMHKEFRFVENVFEELDAPGEWFHNAKTRTLYFHPAQGLALQAATVEIARLKNLVEFRGRQKTPVKHLALTGFTFRHTARTFMETKEPLLRSDWTIYRGGAVTFGGAEDCTVSDCEFDQVGGNAVFVNNYNRRLTVRGAHIHGAGASGVCFVGSPDAVRNPLFEYKEEQSYSEIDKTAGPKSDNYPADCVVEDSLIHDISVVEKQATAVQISMSQGITVRHCSIYDVGRAGINISEGTFGGHLIEFCDVFDTVRETGDHGSFNSWGRDRFWHLKGAPDDELPKLASLDTEKTIIRNSRWRCDHGWDVDLDDGSSHYEIYNNVFLHGGLKLREGFHRKVYNNIAINNTLHPHVWYENSGDRVTGNIWMAAYRPARMDHWGAEIDRNLFTSESDRKAFAEQGCDAHSVVGDPMFMDPAKGDYRVKDGSPALKIGFKNFPMDQFGVQKPALQAIARTPELPEIRIAKEQTKAAATAVWMGATVQELGGEDFSAFGVSKEQGGVAMVKVPKHSAAARAGLQVQDLIQGVNGRPVKTSAELRKALKSLPPGEKIRLKIVRGQQSQTLEIPASAPRGKVLAPETATPKAPPFPGVKSDFHGFEQYDFQLEGFGCRVVVPEQAAAGTPWIWRARFWGHKPNVDLALLKAGYHVVYAEVANLFGSPKAIARWDACYDYLTKEHGFSKKPALEGMSRGGLMVFNWAAKNPDKVSCIYADAPVCDFKSWPAGKGSGPGAPGAWEQCLKAYGMTEAEALAYQGNPLDNLKPLAQAGLPLLHVVGDADEVVPVAENTAILEKRYLALGGSIEVIHKAGVGHKHGLEDPKPVVDFILKHTGNRSGGTDADFILPRNGLGNSAHLFTSTGKGRVAFIGGSITEMDGYRPRVGKVLEEMFPKTEFDFINAGISSTGSTTGAFRLSTDVLSQGPVDLLFIEFAVNDNQDALPAHNRMTLAMEGMVRQARRHNPNIDLVFLYTANLSHLGNFQSGKTPREIVAHDAVAAHYGIPSVSLAADVAARMASGEFDWKKFGGVHPAPFGADLYAEDIKLLLTGSCRDRGKVVAHALPAPREALNYGQGHFVALEKAESESGWTLREPDWKALPGDTRRQFVGIPMLWAEQPGATLRLPFSGSAVGMFLVSGPDAGMVEYRIDDGAVQTIDLFTRHSPGLHYPWTCMFASDLKPGAHTLTLRVSERKNAKSKGTAIRIKTFVAN